MSATTFQARLYHVRGRVQGVGYRNFIQQAAARLAVTGWTRNLDDGRVVVFAQGPLEQMTEFEGLLSKGPRFAEVSGVEFSIATPEHLASFIIRH